MGNYIGQEIVSSPKGASTQNLLCKPKLTKEHLKAIVFKTEIELENLPDSDWKVHVRVRELALMCGGWSDTEQRPLLDNGPTLREHDIL